MHKALHCAHESCIVSRGLPEMLLFTCCCLPVMPGASTHDVVVHMHLGKTMLSDTEQVEQIVLVGTAPAFLRCLQSRIQWMSNAHMYICTEQQDTYCRYHFICRECAQAGLNAKCNCNLGKLLLYGAGLVSEGTNCKRGVSC